MKISRHALALSLEALADEVHRLRDENESLNYRIRNPLPGSIDVWMSDYRGAIPVKELPDYVLKLEQLVAQLMNGHPDYREDDRAKFRTMLGWL